MTKEAEDGSLTDHHVTLRQASLQFGEGEIGLSIHPSLDLTPVRLQCVPFIATKFLRANVPGPSPSREKSADTTDAYAAQIRSFLVRMTSLNRLNDAASQVIRIWLPHLNHKDRFAGIPARFNLFAKCSSCSTARVSPTRN